MTDALRGEGGAYSPCLELAAPLPPVPAGSIVGHAVGFVSRDATASGVPGDPQGAIRGSEVGFVPGPCECAPVGPADGVFLAYRRYVPKVYHAPDPPIGPTIISTGGSIEHWVLANDSGLGADGRGSEGAMQYTVPPGMTLRVNIEVWVFLANTVNNATHPRAFTDIPFQWELRRSHWGAAFAVTYDDFQLDPNGSILGGGTVMPTNQITYPYPTYPTPTIAETRLHLFTYEADLTGDADGKIQFQLRISDLDADAALDYNSRDFGSGSWSPADENGWDDYLYSHNKLYTLVTVCAP